MVRCRIAPSASACALAVLLGCPQAPRPAGAGKGTVSERPGDFVSLAEIDPSVVLELRYFGSHNFLGKRVPGYRAEKCLLTRPTAEALRKAQADLKPFGLSLKVYDCYRPQRAVDAFIAWAKDPGETRMQGEFFPRVPKDRIFAEGYLVARSGHSRGSTVDLTVIALPAAPQESYREGDALRDCGLPAGERFRDNSLDFGTGYDCFDPLANVENPRIGVDQRTKRIMLRALLEKHGFKPYPPEWWHFTLRDEPYPETWFDFEIE
ncbi:MAG TPA: M15 family metallopeptidase [Anaeromyxobacteraceae bacterium]|nr:M15 family metallopeptidase [Anaeromyxobacteraceae bacterium]